MKNFPFVKISRWLAMMMGHLVAAIVIAELWIWVCRISGLILLKIGGRNYVGI